MSRYEVLASRYAILLNLSERLILKHGIARNVASEHDKSHTFHDYLMLCLTKATKTFGSNYILITNYRGEDALILCRSIYEIYLTVSFLLANPGEINSLVAGKIGLKAGDYIEKKRKIIDRKPTTKSGDCSL